MASQFPPVRGAAFTLNFTFYKTDGTIIANPGTITKKLSKDEGAVADIAAAVTEEDTTYGQCSVVFSATEMTADRVWYYLKDDTAGCIPITGVIHTAANAMDDIYTEIGTLKGRLTTTRAGYLDQLEHVADHLDTVVGYGAPPSAATVASSVWSETTRALTDKLNFSLTTTERGLIAQAVWDRTTIVMSGAGTIGKRLVDFITTLVYAAPPTAAAVADAVWDEAVGDHLTESTAGAVVAGTSNIANNIDDKIGTPAVTVSDDIAGISAGTGPTADEVADAVWDEALAGHSTAFSAGAVIAHMVADDDEILSRIGTPNSTLANDINSAAGAATTAASNSGDTLSLVDTIIAYIGTTAITESSLKADVESAVMDSLPNEHTTAGTVGKYLIDIDSNVDATKADAANAVYLENLHNDVSVITLQSLGTSIGEIRVAVDALPLSTAIATQVRNELATELARLDRNVSAATDLLEATVEVSTVHNTIVWKHKDTGAVLLSKSYTDSGETQGVS